MTGARAYGRPFLCRSTKKEKHAAQNWRKWSKRYKKSKMEQAAQKNIKWSKRHKKIIYLKPYFFPLLSMR